MNDYSYLGVANEKSKSRSLSENANQVLVGIKDEVLEKVQFLDEEGNIINQELYVPLINKAGDYIFFRLSTKCVAYPNEGEYYDFCLYLPTGKLFNVTDTLGYLDIASYRRIDLYSTNDGKITFNGNVKNGNQYISGLIEVYVENNELKINKRLDTSLVSGFSFFYKDKYGNIYSLDPQGKMVTTEGKLIKIPLSNEPYVYTQYGLGANGISYYNNGIEKGYFNEKGDLIYIDENGFFPDKINFGEYSNDGIRSNLFYEEDNTLYYTYSDGWAGGIYFRPQGIRKYTYSDSNKTKYTEEFIPFTPSLNCFQTRDGIKKYEQNKNIVSILAKEGLFTFDMRTGIITTISDTYSEYLEFENIGPHLIKFKAIDENMAVVTGYITPEGEIITDIQDIEFDSINLMPIN